MDVNAVATQLVKTYGETGAPNLEQWTQALQLPDNQPIKLINFFKFAKHASYPDGRRATGEEAFGAYAAVSGACLERAGGRFVFMGGSGGVFVGESEDWDLIVVGEYPDKQALLALFQDEEYAHIYPHRVAGCEAQRVLICIG